MIKRGRGGGLPRECHCLWRDYLLLSIRPGGLTPRRPLSNSLSAKVASRRAGYAQSFTARPAAAKAEKVSGKVMRTYGGAALAGGSRPRRPSRVPGRRADDGRPRRAGRHAEPARRAGRPRARQRRTRERRAGRSPTSSPLKTPACSPGCCTSLMTFPSVKGPFWRRFRRMRFDRAPATSSSHPHAPSFPGPSSPSALLVSRVPRELPPIHQRPVPGPFRTFARKRTLRRVGGRWSGSSRAREYVWWRLR
jgi:hypothetical protein